MQKESEQEERNVSSPANKEAVSSMRGRRLFERKLS